MSGTAYWGMLGIVDVTGTPVLITVVVIGLFCLLVPYRLASGAAFSACTAGNV